jgi:hypothetical protein
MLDTEMLIFGYIHHHGNSQVSFLPVVGYFDDYLFG